MSQPDGLRRLTEMAKTNRALIGRARRTRCRCPSAVLNLGAALTAHTASSLELNRFLDDAMLDELRRERRRLSEDLELLESLAERSADSPDVDALAEALLRRILELVEREDRVLYQPLLRSALSGPVNESRADRSPRGAARERHE